MSKIFYFLLFALFAFTLNITIKRKTRCMALGNESDLNQNKINLYFF